MRIACEQKPGGLATGAGEEASEETLFLRMPAETETNSSHGREEDVSEEAESISQDPDEQDDEAESDASLSDASAGSEGQSGMTTGKKKKKVGYLL